MATSHWPIDLCSAAYPLMRTESSISRAGFRVRRNTASTAGPRLSSSLSHLWRGSGQARYYLALKFILWAVTLAASYGLLLPTPATAQPQSSQAASPRGEAYEKCKSFFSGPAKDLLDSEENNAFLNSCGWKFYDYHELPEGEKAFAMAGAMAERRHDRIKQADALDGTANMYRFRSEFDQADRLLQQALAVAKQVQDEDELSKVYLSISRLRWDQGKIDEACDEYLPRVLELLHELDNPLQLAIVNNNLGTCFLRRGDYSGALQPFQQSLMALQQIGEELKSAVVIDNMGHCYWHLGDFPRAIETLRQALAIREKYQDDVIIARSLDSLGNVYLEQGNYAEALRALQEGADLRLKAGFPFDAAESLNNVATVYESQGEYAQAIVYFRRALAIAQKAANRDLAGEINGNLGETYLLEGKSAQASTALQHALEDSRAADDAVEVALAQYLLGKLYLQGGHLDSAKKVLEQARGFYEAKAEIVDLGKTLVELAEVERRSGHLDEGLTLATRARELGDRAGTPELTWRSLTVLGQVNMALGRREEAAKAFEDAIAAIEERRTRVAGSEENRTLFFAAQVTPYQERIALALSSGKTEEALHYAERSKARVLVDAIGANQVPLATAITADEREQETKLRTALASLNSQILVAAQANPPDEKRLAVLKQQRDAARLKYEGFESTLYAAHPELVVSRGTAPILQSNEARTLLPSRSAAIIEYAVVRGQTWAFVISASGIRAFRLPLSNAQLERQVERFRQQLARRDLDVAGTAQQLYQSVLGPASALLKGKADLVIIPDGALWDLPFQALQPVTGRYLIEDSAISYVPSLTALREMRRYRAPAENRPTLMALGNPVISGSVVQRRKLVLMDEHLAPLPEAESQVRSVAEIYRPNSRVYVGSDAREDRWKAEAPSYRILHLATHGVLDNASPLYSYLVLTPSDDRKNPEDGLLEGWEIMRMHLNADLVVLSACETARGKVAQGEGVIGLTWAFFVAGTPATLVTQWKVESASSTQLMTDFHQRWKGGQTGVSKAKALQAAAVQMLHSRDYSHPFYWAGYILVGNGR